MSLNHHLYADDTQLFLSFHPSEFHSNITHLQNVLQQIFSWMTTNRLTLNSSKTEFLLIGLKQQRSKIHGSSLTTTHFDCNLGFIFDEHLTFSDQISALSKSGYYHIREFRCVRPYLDFKTTSTIATSIVHSKLDYCNSLSITTFQTINLTSSNKSRTLLLVLLLRLLNPHISLPFSKSNLSTGLRSMNALNINFFVLLTKFLQPVNLAILTIWSLFNPLAVPAPHRLSPFLAHQLSPHWKSQIAHSHMHHPVSEINSLIHSVSLASHVSTHLLIHLSAYLYYHHHSHHPALLHSFTPGSKPTFSTNPSHLRLLLPTGLPSWQRDWTGPIMLIVLFLVSHFNFLFVSCGGLSWLPVSVLLHVKYTLSYRIVLK